MTFVAATGNAHKLTEMRRILAPLGHDVISQREAGVGCDPEETGATFAENARIKAEAVCKAAGRPAVADDSGLCVDALDGAALVPAQLFGESGGAAVVVDKFGISHKPTLYTFSLVLANYTCSNTLFSS